MKAGRYAGYTDSEEPPVPDAATPTASAEHPAQQVETSAASDQPTTESAPSLRTRPQLPRRGRNCHWMPLGRR